MELEVLISEEEIIKKLNELADKINLDYKNSDKIVVIGVLKGSILVMSDIVKRLNLPIYMDFMVVSSYGNNTFSSGKINIIKDIDENIKNVDVLIIEDIVDTGLTISKVVEHLMEYEPKSIKIMSLLNKKIDNKINMKIDYIGYDICDEFVVGYGLDYAGRYRNLPYIAIMKGEK
ncbi:MAG: hypoxanthine phosphoribosyltransferase [Fusobacteria bacterium]|nr:hypoxanthine phosphoribosyltransferase [Fusobacteriota bacterium]